MDGMPPVDPNWRPTPKPRRTINGKPVNQAGQHTVLGTCSALESGETKGLNTPDQKPSPPIVPRRVSPPTVPDQATIREALIEGDYDALESIFRNNPRAKMEDGQSLIHFICRNTSDPSVISRLGLQGASMNDTNDSLETPLHLAAWQCNKDMISALLEEHGNPNAQDINGLTPLHIAVKQRSTKAVALLLEKRGNPELKTINNNTAYVHAAKDGNLETLKTFKDHGWDWQKDTRALEALLGYLHHHRGTRVEKGTLLALTKVAETPDDWRTLLASGLDLKCPELSLCLHEAIDKHQWDTVNYLIRKNGAHFSWQIGHDGLTPWQKLTHSGQHQEADHLQTVVRQNWSPQALKLFAELNIRQLLSQARAGTMGDNFDVVWRDLLKTVARKNNWDDLRTFLNELMPLSLQARPLDAKYPDLTLILLDDDPYRIEASMGYLMQNPWANVVRLKQDGTFYPIYESGRKPQANSKFVFDGHGPRMLGHSGTGFARMIEKHLRARNYPNEMPVRLTLYGCSSGRSRAMGGESDFILDLVKKMGESYNRTPVVTSSRGTVAVSMDGDIICYNGRKDLFGVTEVDEWQGGDRFLHVTSRSRRNVRARNRCYDMINEYKYENGDITITPKHSKKTAPDESDELHTMKAEMPSMWNQPWAGRQFKNVG
ncbi:ankyrin repeat domain-containing protein [Endozoicomonas arenosclerae]|uniref:ankyrin repeat domain-containing protein n=1 Tax=Endozoicomonas arenosclerae TaxID=1633495 RepID=UPI00078656A6|nr:ankyrin repeat domain-containing protein [Endozoicomonas arenosclerae]